MKEARFGLNLASTMKSAALQSQGTTWAVIGVLNPGLIHTRLQPGVCRPAEVFNRFNGFPRIRKTVETVEVTAAPTGASLKRGVNVISRFRFLQVLGLALFVLSPGNAHAAFPDPARLDRAFTQLATYDAGQPGNALLALDEAISASYADAAARRKIEQRLIAVLKSRAPLFAKQLVCRKLALIGTGDSVPALAPLLADQDLSSVARLALERIPDGDAAFREALPNTRGLLRIGIINSLGAVADAKAAGALGQMLRDPDPALAGAAATALGQIGTAKAARALADFRPAAPGILQPRVDEACLTAAEGLLHRGQESEAARYFRPLYAENWPTVRAGAFRGLIAAEPRKTVELLTQALSGGDAKLLNLASRVIAELPPERALQPLLNSFGSLPARGKIALLDSVQLRGDAKARPAVLAACADAEPEVRAAAVRALGRVGAAPDVPKLVALAATEAGEEGAAARYALGALPGREVSAALSGRLAGSSSTVKIEVMRALAARRATDSAPAIATHLTDRRDPADPVVHAALEALAVVGDEAQVPLVIGSLRETRTESERARVEKTLAALVGRAGPKSLDALLAGVRDLEPRGRIIVLQQLATIGGQDAIVPVRAALAGDDAVVREGAFGVLTVWPDLEAAPDLLKLAQSPERSAWRTPAFRGYVRLCREAPMPPSDRLARVAEAAKIAATTDDKMSVISALADLPAAGSFKLLAGYLDDAALTEAAALGIVKAASNLDSKYRDEAVPGLLRVLKASRNAEAQKQAKDLLKRFGVAVD